MGEDKEEKKEGIKMEKKGLEIDVNNIEKIETKDPSKDHGKKEIPEIAESAWEKAKKEAEEKEKKRARERQED